MELPPSLRIPILPSSCIILYLLSWYLLHRTCYEVSIGLAISWSSPTRPMPAFTALSIVLIFVLFLYLSYNPYLCLVLCSYSLGFHYCSSADFTCTSILLLTVCYCDSIGTLIALLLFCYCLHSMSMLSFILYFYLL